MRISKKSLISILFGVFLFLSANVSMAVPVNFDPGDYLDKYRVAHGNTSGSDPRIDQYISGSQLAFNLNPGANYQLEIGSPYHLIYFDVDSTGNVINVTKEGTAVISSGNTITFLTTPVEIDPGAYLYSWRHSNGGWHTGMQTIALVPDGLYQFSVGYYHRFFFNVDTAGNVTITTKEGTAAVMSGNTLTLLTSTVNIDPGAYAGTVSLQYVVDFSGLDGIQTIDFVSDGRYPLVIGRTPPYYYFFIDVDAAGDVTCTKEGTSAVSSGNTLTLLTSPVNIDPGAYAGGWRIHYITPVYTGSQTINLVPDGKYALTVDTNSNFFNVLSACSIDPPDGLEVGSVQFDITCWGTPPVADAGVNVTIDSSEQLSTILNGTASDPNDDPLTYRWLEGATELLTSTPVVAGSAPLDLSLLAPLSIGAHTLTLEADDGQTTATDDMILTIENSPPTVAPSGGGTFQLGDNITLSGSVADFDGDGLDYRWFEGTLPDFTASFISTTAGGAPVVLPDFVIIGGLPLGNHVITLEGDDVVNSPVSDDISVDVIDTTAPAISATVNPGILWPPNHKMVDVVVQATATDNSGSVTLSATVTSSEPPDTDGDGNTIPDYTTPVIDQSTGEITLQLRSERKGQGTGRTYTITVTATDVSGNSSVAVVEVVAPHDKGKK